jgi:hypothetical protein
MAVLPSFGRRLNVCFRTPDCPKPDSAKMMCNDHLSMDRYFSMVYKIGTAPAEVVP